MPRLADIAARLPTRRHRLIPPLGHLPLFPTTSLEHPIGPACAVVERVRDKTDAPNRARLGYAKLLLDERRKQLQKFAHSATSHDLSCRRSLQQAISQLETLLSDAEEVEESNEICQRNT